MNLTDFMGTIGGGIACFTSILIWFSVNLFLDGTLHRLINCYAKNNKLPILGFWH